MACLLWMTTAAVLCSCNVNRQGARQKVFHINLSSGNLEAIDPAFAKDLYQVWINHMVYNTLVETDDQLHIVPSLAQSWDVNADGKTFIFHLRTDVFFHDNPAFPGGRGRRLLASDVVYSFHRLIDPGTAAPGAWIFNGRIDTSAPFTALNDSTFQLKLVAPFRPLLGMLSMAYCNIVPREVVEKWGHDYRSHPCGTGPFMFRYWDEGNILSLVKNTHYWQHDAQGLQLPYLDAVQVSFIDSKATEFLLFLQHRLDFVNGIDGSFKDLVLSKNGELKNEYKDKFCLSKDKYLNTEYIGFLTDTTRPVMKGEPTGNRLVRQAINYAIDRKKIVTYFKNGMGLPATHGFIPAGIPGYDSSAQYGYTYDPAKAQQLLAQAGFPGGKGLKPVKILVQDNYVDIVNFIAGQLQEVGIPTVIEVMQPNILRQQMSQSAAVMYRGQWLGDYPDAETFLIVFNSRQPAPPNYTRFSNVVFDRWYDECLSLPDTARWAQYRKMDSLAMSYAPLVPLYYDVLLHFTQKNITGFRSNALNVIDISRADIKN